MSLLLDTSAYSALVRGHRGVAWRVRSSRGILLSPVVVGELLYGFRHGSRFDENVARLESFLDRPAVSLLSIGRTTAERYGLVAAALRRRGVSIPTNDLWIAAQALETGADILSSDPHFALVDGVSWLPFSRDGEDSVRDLFFRHNRSVTPRCQPTGLTSWRPPRRPCKPPRVVSTSK